MSSSPSQVCFGDCARYLELNAKTLVFIFLKLLFLLRLVYPVRTGGAGLASGRALRADFDFGVLRRGESQCDLLKQIKTGHLIIQLYSRS